MRIAVSLKMVVLFGFVVALPLLALPVAARLIDVQLNGAPPAELAAAPLLEEPLGPATLPIVVERFSPALANNPASDAYREPGGLDVAGSSPPTPPANFDPLWSPRSESPTAESPVDIDDATVARLQQIRQRLEELGAEYVIVETTDDTGRFRFHCRMIVEAQSRFTRPFEAISADPLAAGERVLLEVEAWRLAGVEKRSRQE